MDDWNVVVSVRGEDFDYASRVLQQLGAVARTHFYNVLVMRVEDRRAFMDRLATLGETVPKVFDAISRVVPVEEAFDFKDVADFETTARERLGPWLPRLAGRSFHVRIHRRGLKGVMRSPDEERALDDFILKSLEEAETPGRIAFDDPDAVIDVETLDKRAGLMLCSREEQERYPFLRPD